MTLEANQFSWGGYVAGSFGAPGVQLYTLVAAGDALNGLQTPPRRTTLTDLQGHGQHLGSQWASSRRITATVWTDDVETVYGFDATMAPRPDPTDVAPWVGSFLGLGERIAYAVPEYCDWSFDDRASIGMWRMECAWIVPDPTLYGQPVEVDLDPTAQYHDLTVTNTGTSEAEVAWTLTLTADGAVSDPYIQIQGDVARSSESVRITGLNLSDGQTVTIDRDRIVKVGTLGLNGLLRSRGQKVLTWPRLKPGAQTVRIGAISGNIGGTFTYQSTWSV